MSAGHYHLHLHPISRRKGHHIQAAVAYRHAAQIFAASAAAAYRHATLHGNDGDAFDYRGKVGVAWFGIFAPGQAPDWTRDPATLWARVDATETRSNARLAQEVIIALPHQVSLDDHVAMLTEFVTRHCTAPYAMIADVAVHLPPTHRGGDPRNVHAHILLTDRPITPNGFSRTKDRRYSDKRLVDEFREGWTNIHNRHMEGLGLPYRIDHRRLEQQRADAIERGDEGSAILLDRVAQIHLGKAVHATHPDATIYQDRLRRNRAILAANTAHHEQLEAETAAEHHKAAHAALREDWQIRKAIRDFNTPSFKELQATYGRPPPTSTMGRFAQAVRDDHLQRRALAIAKEHNYPWINGHTRPDAPSLGDILLGMATPEPDKQPWFTVTARDFAFIFYSLGFSTLLQLRDQLADIAAEEERKRAEREGRAPKPPPRPPTRKLPDIPRPMRGLAVQLDRRLGHLQAALEAHHGREAAFERQYEPRAWIKAKNARGIPRERRRKD